MMSDDSHMLDASMIMIQIRIPKLKLKLIWHDEMLLPRLSDSCCCSSPLRISVVASYASIAPALSHRSE